MKCLQICILLSYFSMVLCFVCTKTGKYRVNRSCGTYFNCQESGKYPGVLIHTQLSCGGNKIFYPTSKTNGKCDVNAVCVDSLCQGKAVGSVVKDPNEPESPCQKNYYKCTYTGVITPQFDKCDSTKCFDSTTSANPCIEPKAPGTTKSSATTEAPTTIATATTKSTTKEPSTLQPTTKTTPILDPKSPECEDVGSFRIDGTGCKQYYTCEISKDEFVKTIQTCESGIFCQISPTEGECSPTCQCVDGICEGKSINTKISDANEAITQCPINYYECKGINRDPVFKQCPDNFCMANVKGVENCELQ